MLFRAEKEFDKSEKYCGYEADIVEYSHGRGDAVAGHRGS
jgi:hypothetical protein